MAVFFLFLFEAGHVREKMRPNGHMQKCWFCGKQFAVWTIYPTLMVGGWRFLLGQSMFTLQEHQVSALASQNCFRQFFSTICVWWMSWTFQPNAHWETLRKRFGWGWTSHWWVTDELLFSEWNLLYWTERGGGSQLQGLSFLHVPLNFITLWCM